MCPKRTFAFQQPNNAGRSACATENRTSTERLCDVTTELRNASESVVQLR
ncbi:hypothetical protein AKJ09_09253 [Labilithrix luteola]|uniref:Uncharacterized protein n=1 Tax=Labilithrix luteola TaxID=1391654 RepID=A0A0K1QAZ3_9BACT|nr:hypothetical protein AKJ09_09253 [Labilithrix luteola]